MSFILLGILNSQVEGGAAGAYELIESQVLTSSASSVTFSSLDTVAADYKHLQIRAAYKSDSLFGIRFNGDTGSNYSSHNLVGNGSSVSSSYLSLTYGYIGRNETTTNAFAGLACDVLDFASSSKNTTVRALYGSAGTDNRIMLNSALWLNTNPVTSITLLSASGNLLTGSRFSLYGIRG